MGRIEDKLKKEGIKYAYALRALGILISFEEATRQVDAAYRKAGKSICGDFYLETPWIERRKILEEAYKLSQEEDITKSEKDCSDEKS